MSRSASVVCGRFRSSILSRSLLVSGLGCFMDSLLIINTINTINTINNIIKAGRLSSSKAGRPWMWLRRRNRDRRCLLL